MLNWPIVPTPSTRGVNGLIELLSAAQACDFHAPLTSSVALEAARATLRAQVPRLEDDRYFHPDIDKAIGLVRSGALVDAVTDAASDVRLPDITAASMVPA